MSYRERQLGVIPSPQDYRDYKLNRVTLVKRTFPDQYTYPYLITQPYDQKNIGACVPFSLKAIKEMQEYKERQEFTKFSAAYIYGARGPDDFKGEGMIPREALNTLRNRGACREDMFPGIYPYPICAQSITVHMDNDALPQRIKTYTAIHTVEEAKTALLELGPICIGFSVYDSFFQGGHLPRPDKTKEKLHGFHMMTIVGWTKDNRWLALNSWGQGWGKLKGYCTIPYDYPINEMWALTDMVTQKQPDYEVALIHRGRYWGVYFTSSFRSSAEAMNKLLRPLEKDLSLTGRILRIRNR